MCRPLSQFSPLCPLRRNKFKNKGFAGPPGAEAFFLVRMAWIAASEKCIMWSASHLFAAIGDRIHHR